MSLIRNEHIKLTANALDRASTASVAAGLIAPVVASGNGANNFPFSWWSVLSVMIWFLVAYALHMAGRHVLTRLEP